MIQGHDLAKNICGHSTDRLVVHAVEGGYKAHCLCCGAIGPVRHDRATAREAIPTGRSLWMRPPGNVAAGRGRTGPV